MATEPQIRELAATTPLSYDTIAALADRAERYGMSDEAFVALVVGACVAEADARGIVLAIDTGIDAWRKRQMAKERGQ